MNRSVLLRVVCLAALLVVFGCASDSAFAQRGGGHGGGGGFHGGGGGFHGGGAAYHGGAMGHSYSYGGYHGGGYAGGYHGGYNGYHGGYYGGWHGGYHGGYYGGYWGYPRYGWGWGGWGFGLSFNWGGYWPSYPYAYGYAAPYPYYPYPYYYYATPASDPSSDPPAENQSSPNVQDNLPPAPSSATVAPGAFYANSANMRHAASQRAVPATTATVHYLNASYTKEALPHLTPLAQNAIRALRAMPPYARAEQLSRYGSLSPEEVKLVRRAVGMPPV